MVGSVNKVTLVGNVGKDPEIRFLPDGSKVASFSVATSESWKDKTSGERKEKTEWHRVSVMNDRLADVVEKYVRKGSKLFVEGQIQSRRWTDQAGVERNATDVVIGRYRGELVLLDGRSNNDETLSEFDKRNDDKPSAGSKLFDDLDDDIPF